MRTSSNSIQRYTTVRKTKIVMLIYRIRAWIYHKLSMYAYGKLLGYSIRLDYSPYSNGIPCKSIRRKYYKWDDRYNRWRSKYQMLSSIPEVVITPYKEEGATLDMAVDSAVGLVSSFEHYCEDK